MMRIIPAIASLAILIVVQGFAQDSISTTLSINYVGDSITVDARFNDWGKIAPVELTSSKLVRGASWNGPDDLSARVWLGWNEQRLYFGADLKDDDFFGLASGKPLWESDSLIITLRFPNFSPQGDRFYLMVSCDDSEAKGLVLRGREGSFSHVEAPSLQLAHRMQDNSGPLIEGSLDWANLIGSGPVPEHIEINIEVRDVDKTGSMKSIAWIPSSGKSDLSLAVLLRPKEFQGLMPTRDTSDLVEYINLVRLPTVVTDGQNNYIRDLDKKDFTVFEDDKEQVIDDLRFETRPVTVGLLIDSSGSMEHHIGSARKAAINFLDALRDEDRAFVISFNDNIELLKDFDGGSDQAKEAIDKISAHGGTMLYGALYFALHKMVFVREKKVLVLLSDGKDESVGLINPFGEKISFDMVLEEAKRREVSVYAIAYRLADSKAISDLSALVRETGGKIYTPADVSSLIGAYEEIAEDLKSQYLITYITNNRDWDGRWRKIEVKIPGKNYNVRVRKGYYAPSR